MMYAPAIRVCFLVPVATLGLLIICETEGGALVKSRSTSDFMVRIEALSVLGSVDACSSTSCRTSDVGMISGDGGTGGAAAAAAGATGAGNGEIAGAGGASAGADPSARFALSSAEDVPPKEGISAIEKCTKNV